MLVSAIFKIVPSWIDGDRWQSKTVSSEHYTAIGIARSSCRVDIALDGLLSSA
jgi:hypothetical protein